MSASISLVISLLAWCISVSMHLWKSDSLQELVFFVHQRTLGIKLKYSGLLAVILTDQAT